MPWSEYFPVKKTQLISIAFVQHTVGVLQLASAMFLQDDV